MAQIPSKQNGYSRVETPEPSFTIDIETPGMGDLLRPGVPVLLETQSVEEDDEWYGVYLGESERPGHDGALLVAAADPHGRWDVHVLRPKPPGDERWRLSVRLEEISGCDAVTAWMGGKLGWARSFLTSPQFLLEAGWVLRGEDGWVLRGEEGNYQRFSPVPCNDAIHVPGLPLTEQAGVEAIRLCALALAKQ